MVVRRPGAPDWAMAWDAPKVGRVLTELTGLGTIVATADGDRAWGMVPPLLLDPEPDTSLAALGLAQWMRVTAAWYASRDDLDGRRALTRSWFA